MILAREKIDYQNEYNPWAQKPRQARKVRKVKKFNSKVRVFYAGVAVFGFVVFLLLATRYAQIAATGYEILDMKKQLKVLQAENQSLQMKVAELESLERIEAEAVGKLGMVKPNISEGVQLVAVENDLAEEKMNSSNQEEQLGNVAINTTEKEEQKSIAVVEAITNLINNWTGKVAQAETKSATD